MERVTGIRLEETVKKALEKAQKDPGVCAVEAAIAATGEGLHLTPYYRLDENGAPLPVYLEVHGAGDVRVAVGPEAADPGAVWSFSLDPAVLGEALERFLERPRVRELIRGVAWNDRDAIESLRQALQWLPAAEVWTPARVLQGGLWVDASGLYHLDGTMLKCRGFYRLRKDRPETFEEDRLVYIVPRLWLTITGLAALNEERLAALKP